MEPVFDNSTAYGLREAKSHPEDHPPRTPELGEGAAGMVLTLLLVYSPHAQAVDSIVKANTD